MSSINGLGGSLPVQRVVAQPIQRSVSGEQAGTAPARASDKLELSDVSHYLQNLKAAGEVRTQKVAEVREAIQAGTYEDDFKLNIAIDRLLDDLNA